MCVVPLRQVDTQQVLEQVGSGAGEPGAPAIAAAFHDALEDSVESRFPGNHMINCMCHSSEVCAALLRLVQCTRA